MMNTIRHKDVSQRKQIHKLAQAGFRLTVIALLSLSVSSVAIAHGGEDHGDAAAPIQMSSSRIAVSAQSENFDIVVEYSGLEPGKKVSLDIYLSDYETNAPIPGATIQVSVSGIENVSATATSEKDPGLYSVALTFPKVGTYDLLFDITSPDKSDIIELKGIKVGTDEVPVSKSKKQYAWLIIVVGFGAALTAALFLLKWRRKSMRRVVKTASTILLLLGLSHGDSGGVTAATGAPGYMSKGSQFLLGVRTVLAKTQTVSKQITALGRVVAPPTSQVQVYAPQSGQLVATNDVPYPNQGDWVKKGQPIAVLQVLDQFVIRAPISGIVSAIHAVPGEQVDPSHELFTIYDYTKVWVEANLFEDDLIHLEPKPPASLSIDIYPGKSFPIRFVNFDNIVDPNTRTLKAIYEVSNPKMILRPGMVVNVNIESQRRLDARVVPINAIMDWEGQKVIFVHEAPEIFEMRPIKILGYYGDLVAVEGPLVDGDRVVTTGAYELLNIPHKVAEGWSK